MKFYVRALAAEQAPVPFPAGGYGWQPLGGLDVGAAGRPVAFALLPETDTVYQQVSKTRFAVLDNLAMRLGALIIVLPPGTQFVELVPVEELGREPPAATPT